FDVHRIIPACLLDLGFPCGDAALQRVPASWALSLLTSDHRRDDIETDDDHVPNIGTPRSDLQAKPSLVCGLRVRGPCRPPPPDGGAKLAAEHAYPLTKM